jgi:hypothetical protein
MRERIEGKLTETKKWWGEFNEVDSYGINGPAALVGIGLISVLAPIAYTIEFVTDGEFRQEVVSGVSRTVREKAAAVWSRRFDSRMSRAAGAETPTDSSDQPKS